MMSEAMMQFPSDQDSTGRTLGEDEIAAVVDAIRSGTLTSTKGRFVKEFQAEFAKLVGAAHGYACSSGTSAIHAAIAAVDPAPGDEIITSPITDMGAITPILYQTAIPVFADVDPFTGNVTADTVRAAISPKTKAVIVTHLFGNPADLDGICAVAREHGILVIEDCAQAYGATLGGRPVGTIGDIGCFSLQQGKHITTGEGGIVVTDDEALARRLRLFIDKAWGYGDPKPDHYFAALNSRMTELQGAVALAQLGKLSFSVAQRQAMAGLLSDALSGVAGIGTPKALPGAVQSFWKYALIVSPEAGGPVRLAQDLKGFGIMSAPRYIQKPAFECEVIRDQRTFGDSRFPFTLARPEAVDYAHDRFPGTYAFLRDVLVLPINEKYTEAHVDYLAAQLRTILSSPRTMEAAE
jgi:dTDP-4-amino-4,6-dideoxygalactose transaminase